MLSRTYLRWARGDTTLGTDLGVAASLGIECDRELGVTLVLGAELGTELGGVTPSLATEFSTELGIYSSTWHRTWHGSITWNRT